MAKPGCEPKKRRGRAPKEAVVGEITKLIEQGHGFILLNNKGLTVADSTKLRQELRDNDVAVRVVKNRLLKLALQNNEIDPAQFDGMLTQETVIAIGMEDPVTPAKLLSEFCKERKEKLYIKGGYLDGKVMQAEDVDMLSKVPGREELYQRMLGSLMSPIQKLVFGLNDGVAKPAYLFDALRRKKEEEAA